MQKHLLPILPPNGSPFNFKHKLSPKIIAAIAVTTIFAAIIIAAAIFFMWRQRRLKSEPEEPSAGIERTTGLVEDESKVEHGGVHMLDGVDQASELRRSKDAPALLQMSNTQQSPHELADAPLRHELIGMQSHELPAENIVSELESPGTYISGGNSDTAIVR